MARKSSPKEFTYTWAFEAFDRDRSFCEKRMFGGLAAYVQGRMVMVLVEDPGERSYRGKTYDLDLWDGILLPTEREFHAELRKQFKGLMPHPVLGKWLYLPAACAKFETLALKISGAIAAFDPRFGIDPKLK